MYISITEISSLYCSGLKSVCIYLHTLIEHYFEHNFVYNWIVFHVSVNSFEQDGKHVRDELLMRKAALSLPINELPKQTC